MKYRCTNCDHMTLRWEGRCSSCGEWGTYEEFEDESVSTTITGSTNPATPAKAVSIKSVAHGKGQRRSVRISSGIGEFDRVLGSGFVDGEVVLVTGEPGIGKSTLLTQLSIILSQKYKVLYVAGEESVGQVSQRYTRVNESGSLGDNIEITPENDVDAVCALLEKSDHKFVIVDSIQSVRTSASKGYPGSISQVRLSGQRLMELAKRSDKILLIVGQINKEGAIAGPKVLEHMVDAVIHFEGSKEGYFRILRPLKNRFGATTEIGIFEMMEKGFREVPNPSEIFIDTADLSPGAALGAVIEGSRVVLLEVQALVVDHGSSPGPLRRVANGIKRQRLEMLCAVLTRRGGVFLADKDVYVNISGGLNVNSTSMDLAICAAISSSLNDKALSKEHVYAGEVGLTGETKPFYGIDQVRKEVERLGYKKVFMPMLGGRGARKSSKASVFQQVVKHVSSI